MMSCASAHIAKTPYHPLYPTNLYAAKRVWSVPQLNAELLSMTHKSDACVPEIITSKKTPATVADRGSYFYLRINLSSFAISSSQSSE